MSTANSNGSSAVITWGVALAATSLLIIGGGAIIWNNPAPPRSATDVESSNNQPMSVSRSVPMPDEEAHAKPDAALHSIIVAHENGTRVVKIKVSPNGDELVIDARTGRLIEARPPRSTAPPMGRLAAPFVPMT